MQQIKGRPQVAHCLRRGAGRQGGDPSGPGRSVLQRAAYAADALHLELVPVRPGKGAGRRHRPGAWRRQDRVHGFLAKSPSIYSLYYEAGRREYQQLGPREGVLTTDDAETYSAPDCLTVVGWYRKALEMCGVMGVRVVEEECRANGGKVCRYRVKWE